MSNKKRRRKDANKTYPPNWENRTLFNADNLEIMRGMNSGSVPLIYADPPFNSNAVYQATPGSKADGQKFDDRWSWSSAKQEWLDMLQDNNRPVYDAVNAAKACHSDGMGGYIAFMAPRIIEMHRILSPTGSMYLHCDPTAGPYLRMVADAVFGRKQFRSEIVWRRAKGKNSVTKKYGANHDTLLYYSKSDKWTFNKDAMTPARDPGIIPAGYRLDHASGRYWALSPMDAPAPRNGDSGRPATFRGVTYQVPEGRHWRVPGGRLPGETTSDGWARLDKEGRMYLTPQMSRPMFIRYLDEVPGVPMDDIWNNINNVGNKKEKTGWATAKPEQLLEQIIRVSSNPGDMVFDPFCGCATTMVVAEKNHRQWVGIDIEPYAIGVVVDRLSNAWLKPDDIKKMNAGQLRLFVEQKVNFKTDAPQRNEQDMAQAPLLAAPEYRRRQLATWEKFSHKEMREHLASIQQNGVGGIICLGCGIELPLRLMHLDHQTPKSDGGADTIDNRVLICSSCNGIKSNSLTLTSLVAENEKRHYLQPNWDRKTMSRIVRNLKEKVEALKRDYQ